MSRLVLRGARWPGDVAVEDGRIVAVGSVPEEPGDEVVRVDGDLVTAGLVNTHHHFCQWMTRGRAVGCDLFGWLTELYPVGARLSAEDVHAAALVALAELALTGCTAAADHHYVVPGGDDSVFDAIAAAARTVGIRVHLARGSMDLGESKGGLPPTSWSRSSTPSWPRPSRWPPGSRTASGSWSPVRDGELLGADAGQLRRELARRARRVWPE